MSAEKKSNVKKAIPRWNKRWIQKSIIIIGWLLVWQLVSLWVGNDILLVGPWETLKTLWGKLWEAAFWQACICSVFRICAGFLAGMLLGVTLAAVSVRYSVLEEILAPVMTLLKAVPVASFVVLFLIWWSSAWLATAISFCIVLPNLYINTLEGMKSTDRKLLEMARVFRISRRDQFLYIYRPALKPFWDSAIRLAAGMSWKSGVAAEVIGLPEHAIGEQLYMSKIYLDTAGVLAWTVMIILISIGFEKLILKAWELFCAWEPACDRVCEKERTRPYEKPKPLQLQQVSKSYSEKTVMERVSAEYLPGETAYFRMPSGSGKTTLFRLIAGLEKPDEGKICGSEQKVAFLFQEDRLCEEYSALKNVELVTGDKTIAREHLLQLLEEEDIYKKCRELSGGMIRRVALARTMAAKADIILLDEPYNGLDEANREKVLHYIEENSGDAILLIATHIK